MTGDLDLCRAFIEAHPADAAQALERLPPPDVAALLDAMAPPVSAGLLDRMAPAVGADCLTHMQPSAAAALVGALPTDLATALLRRVDDSTRQSLLEKLPEQETADVLRTALRYPEGTAGALMDPRVLAVADDVTAGEALTRMRRSPGHMLYYLYVVDRARRLAGVIGVRELMLARASEPLGAVMRRPVARVTANMSRAAILVHPAWSQFHALPVVDEGSTLVGVIRYRTFRRLEEDARGGMRGGDAVPAVLALGELYWLGLSGMLDGLASAVKRTTAGDRRREEDDHGRA